MGRQSNLDNHANQMNPNNGEYYNSRGEDPHGGDDWFDDDDEEEDIIITSLGGNR